MQAVGFGRVGSFNRSILTLYTAFNTSSVLTGNTTSDARELAGLEFERG
jgi:hypothetical protein